MESENEARSSDGSISPIGGNASFIEMDTEGLPTVASDVDSEDEHSVDGSDEENVEPEVEAYVNSPEEQEVDPPNDSLDCEKLSRDEIALIRMQLRSNLSNIQQPEQSVSKNKDTEKNFRVPKEHPIWGGEPDKLETFIVEMELTHARETSGKMADMDNPGFITKLIPYFKPETSARIWFKMYASRRARAGLKLTWKRLVRDLRESYGVFDQPDLQFEEYYEMMQNGDDVKTYIAKKCEAALMSEDLTPRLLKFGFIRGLNVDIRNYVKLQKPATLEDAQRIAIDYANSIKGKSNSKRASSESSKKSDSRKEIATSSSGTRKRSRKNDDQLSESQKTALEKLRTLRRDKCFNCGISGHRREACKTDQTQVKKHQELITGLKNKINNK